MQVHGAVAAARNFHLPASVLAGRPATSTTTLRMGSFVCACQPDDHLANPATASSLRGRPEPIVQYQPKARRVSPVPQNVPVVHSSAYLLRRSKPKEGDRPAVQSPRDNAVDPVEQNAVEWALGQADAYFDRVEADTDTKSAARVLVKNPAAQLTMKTMQGVTILGAATAPELAKAALPVGKKLLSVGADVLVAGVGALNNAAKKSKAQKNSERQ